MTIASNNKRIATNTMFLYIRMFVMMAVSLFTSRIVLDALGETDYGIYNIVGSVVVLFSFLNSALTAATQRFLNYYLGEGNTEQLAKVFCMSMNSYIILSAIFLVGSETAGLWFFHTQLSIPAERMAGGRQLGLPIFSTDIHYQFDKNSIQRLHHCLRAYGFLRICKPC